MEAEQLYISQSSTLAPAQPAYVFRGHTAQVHAITFLRGNLRLLSGDADGWVVLWNIPIRRPVAVWKPHNGSILGLGSWDEDKVITHGRDNKLLVWHLRSDDEDTFSTVLPNDDTSIERPQPWMLHSLAVNALNFCAFAMCNDPIKRSDVTEDSSSILVATPGVQDGWINVTSLPSEERIATIPSPKDTDTGMIMAIGVLQSKSGLKVLAGYESGHAVIWQQNQSSSQWQVIYMTKFHTQPILSLDITPDEKFSFTSSADAIIAKHALEQDSSGSKTVQTKHAGQQSLSVRSDGKVFATAGWDGRLRVYSTKTMKELAVLKWHKEGCYAVALAAIASLTENDDSDLDANGSLIKRELTMSEQRISKARNTHWLAGGSKDGKISLWDIY